MANHPFKPAVRNLICLVAVCCFGIALLLQAQQRQLPVTYKGWSQRQFYDPPHETQMKMELSGAEAEPLPGSKFLVKGMKIRTFPETGGNPQMIAEAPEC